jgi:hypothetical protein
MPFPKLYRPRFLSDTVGLSPFYAHQIWLRIDAAEKLRRRGRLYLAPGQLLEAWESADSALAGAPRFIDNEIATYSSAQRESPGLPPPRLSLDSPVLGHREAAGQDTLFSEGGL